MIKYTIRCADGHDFEGWFKDSASFDEQAEAGAIECPHCGNAHVAKAPMAPNITKARPAANPEVRAREVAEKILDAVKNVREHVEANCDYVGEEFAVEAKRIHKGEAEERGIYGEASAEEAEDLTDEGVEFYRLPTVPRRDS